MENTILSTIDTINYIISGMLKNNGITGYSVSTKIGRYINAKPEDKGISVTFYVQQPGGDIYQIHEGANNENEFKEKIQEFCNHVYQSIQNIINRKRYYLFTTDPDAKLTDKYYNANSDECFEGIPYTDVFTKLEIDMLTESGIITEGNNDDTNLKENLIFKLRGYNVPEDQEKYLQNFIDKLTGLTENQVKRFCDNMVWWLKKHFNEMTQCGLPCSFSISGETI